MNREILDLSTLEILSLYEAKKLSPVDVAKACLAQIADQNPRLNAYCLIGDEKATLERAKESEARWMKGTPRGPLEGVPMSIKDGYDVTGWPTREGSLITPQAPKTEDSLVVKRLRDAGAIFLGKTTMPEFGLKGVTHGRLNGTTRNPWNPAKTTGGSSGGDGAAAATRMGFLHLGSDGGGSIRIPASFCGVFGIKPSSGLVPGWPPSPFSTLASAGPIARSVAEAALMLDVITRPEKKNWQALPGKEDGIYSKNLVARPRRMRVAYARTINGTKISPAIAALVENAAKRMSGDHDVEEITLDLPGLVDTFNRHWMSIAAWILSQIPAHAHDRLDPYILEWAQRGQKLSLNQFLDAEKTRLEITARMNELFADYDALILPTMPMTAFDADLNCPVIDGKVWDDWTPLTFPGNMARLPASSVPCGLTPEGMPAGIQVVGGFLREDNVLALSRDLEEKIGFRDWIKSGLRLKKAAA